MTTYLLKPTRRETAEAMAAIHTAGSNSVLDFWIALSPHVRITMIVVAALAVFLTAIH